MEKSLLYINYLYLSLVILWNPLRMTVFHGDSKGRILFLLTFVVLIANTQSKIFKKIALSKPAAIWLAWVIYTFMNMGLQGARIDEQQGLVFFFVNNLFTPYLCLCLACKEMVIDKTTFLRVMLITYLAYTIIGFFFMNTVRGDSTADEGFTLGNALALTTCYIIFFVLLLNTDKKISPLVAILLVTFVVVIVTMTATRKAFGAAAIMLLFYVLSRIELSPKNILFVLLAFIVVYYGMGYVMENTLMGERFLSAGEQAERVYDGDNPLLKFVGDRAIHYVLGWDLFLSHPINGVGLYNFMYVTGYPERIHSEYIVNLAENGIIGTAFFAWFYTYIIKAVLRMRSFKQWKKTAYICLGVVVAILFIGFTSWLYEHPRNFICLGIVMGSLMNTSMNKNLNLKPKKK